MRGLRAPLARVALLATATLPAGCASSPSTTPARSSVPSTRAPSAIVSTTSTLSARPATTSTSTTDAGITTTTTTTAIAAFRSSVERITAGDIPSTYRSGCPVGPAQLRRLRLSYWGFDAHAHTGTLIVAASVAEPVITVFAALFAQRFPIRSMEPEDAYGGRDPASMVADNTSGFNCRNAVAAGLPRWSAHAYGTAIDVDPVENPYLEGGVVQPPNGRAFVDRSRVRPGMAVAGSVLNRAFAAVGWQWGGRWTSSPDYQHFSADGG